MRTGFIVLLVALAGISSAHADDAAQARALYQKARGHFAVGEFAAAASEYEEAFKLKQDAALLFNAAQSRRLAGENAKALVLYKNYLQLYPKARNVDQVREQIGKVEEAISAAESAKTAPPINTVEPGKSEPSTEPPPSTSANANANEPPPAAEATPSPAAPADQTPLYKKWWLWTAIGGAVVLAVVIPVAVVETQPAPKWSSLPDQGPGAHALSSAPATALMVRW